MVKVMRLSKVSLSELQEEQIDLLKEALENIKFITSNSLEDAQKKEEAKTAFTKSIELEKNISSQLIILEKCAQDFTLLAKDHETAQRIHASIPFLTKYKVEEWLVKLVRYIEEDNFALVKRTIEEEMLDPHFGMVAGRYEHTKSIEQILPEEELNEALAYNNSWCKLKEVLGTITTKSESAQFKEGVNKEQLLAEFKTAVRNLLGKGFWLWKKGVIPEIEALHKKDISAKEKSQELAEAELNLRTDVLKKLESTLMKVSQSAYILLESNISSTSEQIEYHKKDLAETLVLFQTRALNLIIPLRDRSVLRNSFQALSTFYNQINKIRSPNLEVSISSDVPEFAYEYFLAMENLAKEARKKAEDGDYKNAVFNLEQIYRISLRREWERLKKMKDARSSSILMQRNMEVQESVQEIRNILRDKDNREKEFTQLVLILEQTNQLLAARKG